MCQTKYDFVKGQKSWGLNTKPCHKLYKIDHEVKGQRRIRIMNVLDTSSHGDRPMCQVWYANVKANRSYRSDMKTWQKPINLTLTSKVNIKSGTWMNVCVSHLLIVIDPCAKYGKPMSNQKNSYGPDTKTWQKPYKFDLEVKFKVISGSWMYATHRLMVIHPCAKYSKLISNQKKGMDQTWKHVKAL